jgi:hypothetical protein
LANENIPGRCFRTRASSVGPRISPLATEYECPQPSLFALPPRAVAGPRGKTRSRPGVLRHAPARLKHPPAALTQAARGGHPRCCAASKPAAQQRGRTALVIPRSRIHRPRHPAGTPPEGRPGRNTPAWNTLLVLTVTARPRFEEGRARMIAGRGATPALCCTNISATSVSTAASRTSPIGAGITAAAGTRLSLRRILGEGFGLLSFQAPDRGSGLTPRRRRLC